MPALHPFMLSGPSSWAVDGDGSAPDSAHAALEYIVEARPIAQVVPNGRQRREDAALVPDPIVKSAFCAGEKESRKAPSSAIRAR
jgi:hypothetical protein